MEIAQFSEIKDQWEATHGRETLEKIYTEYTPKPEGSQGWPWDDFISSIAGEDAEYTGSKAWELGCEALEGAYICCASDGSVLAWDGHGGLCLFSAKEIEEA